MIDDKTRGRFLRGVLSVGSPFKHCSTVDEAMIPEFLALQLGSPYGKRYFLGCAKKTSNLASINSTQVNAFPFQLPKLAEQERFIREVERLQPAGDALASHLSSTREILKQLAEAFT
jgi:type I restriction enzyme, S subunit